MAVTDQYVQLRAWAARNDQRAAAVELLIRAGLADLDHPWVVHHQPSGTRLVDFTIAADTARELPPAEQSLIALAAALAEGDLVDLRDCVTRLNYEQVRLVMIAIAHAAGRHHVTFATPPGRIHASPLAPLATWDDSSPSAR